MARDECSLPIGSEDHVPGKRTYFRKTNYVDVYLRYMQVMGGGKEVGTYMGPPYRTWNGPEDLKKAYN